jgi:plasmid stabilization system protein ParE
LNVRFTPRARRRVKAVETWWRANRPSTPSLFADELSEAIQRLRQQPTLGSKYESVSGAVVRRLLLPKTAQHVYYVVDDDSGDIVVHTVWGARRSRAPKL